ncbi:hypothetical protein MASR1M74_00560 [Lentimicrobium sp.]
MIFLFLLAAIAPAFAIKEERKVAHFTELEVSSAFKVFLTQGSEEKLLIDASEVDLKEVITEVKDNKLIIRLTPTNFSRQIGNISVFLTFTTLTDIDVSGAVELKGSNEMRFNELEIEGSGASIINLNISAKKLECELSGASSATLIGQTDYFNIDISGASKLNAMEVLAKTCKLKVSGASSAKVNVKDTLRIDGSGASEVLYSGNPNVVETELSGASKVKKAN